MECGVNLRCKQWIEEESIILNLVVLLLSSH